MTLSLSDREHTDNRFSFLLNFNKTRGALPDQAKLSADHEAIIKEFLDDLEDELMLLFKQRYMEAKAYGENSPMSYLVFEPGKYTNYMELAPKSSKLLDFKHKEEKHFAEDMYELDPRNDNKSVRLSFYKFDENEEKLPPILNYTYYFSEKKRMEADAKLPPEHVNLLLDFNQFIPNLFDILKERYKEAKTIGEELMKSGPALSLENQKVQRNDMCPCGSGKKFKKCCGSKVH